MEDVDSKICPACDAGKLRELFGSEEFSYNGQSFVLETIAFSACDACGAELVTPEQARSNDRLVREEHRRIDGLLSGAEIKSVRLRFQLTQHDASFVFGGGLNAFSKYERGEVIQSVAMDRLVRLVDMIPGAFFALVKIAYGTSPRVVDVVTSERNFFQSYAHDDEWSVSNVFLSHEATSLSLVTKNPEKETHREVEKYRRVAA